jgi:HSP20 family protein
VAFSRWDPLQDLLALHERMTRLAGTDTAGWMPPVDLYETADRFVIAVELAGLGRDDFTLEVHEGRLTLRGERRPGARGEQYHLVERGHGQFTRTFALPDSVDPERIAADLKRGILRISIPKSCESRERRVEVL